MPVTLFVVSLLARHWASLVVSASGLAGPDGMRGPPGGGVLLHAWFGGWCYGPRYTTEWVPWLVLLAVIGIRAALDWYEDIGALRHVAEWRTTLVCGGFLLLLSICVNEPGLYAVSTAEWNRSPEIIDEHPERVWDWRYPEFLAGIVDPPPPTVLPAWGRPSHRLRPGGGPGVPVVGLEQQRNEILLE